MDNLTIEQRLRKAVEDQRERIAEVRAMRDDVALIKADLTALEIRMRALGLLPPLPR